MESTKSTYPFFLTLSTLLLCFFFIFADCGRCFAIKFILSFSRLKFFFGFLCLESALGWRWPTNVLGEIRPLLSFLLARGDSMPSFRLLLWACFGSWFVLYSKWWLGMLEWKPIAEWPPPSGLLAALLLGLVPLEVRGLLACWLGAVVLSPLSMISLFFFIVGSLISFLWFLEIALLDTLMCSLKYRRSFKILSMSSSSTCSTTLLLCLLWCFFLAAVEL